MKILYVIQSLEKGGAERLALDILKEVKKRPGITARLVFLEEPNDYIKEYGSENPELCRILYKKSLIRKSDIDLTPLFNIIEDFMPDVIHAHLYFSDLILHEKIIPGIKYISHVHGRISQYETLNPFRDGIKQYIVRTCEKNGIFRKYRKSKTTILCISTQQVEMLKSNLPSDLHPSIVMLPNAIQLKKFTCTEKRIITPGEPIRLISVGSLIPRKNHFFTLKIVRQLLDKGINVHLTILGNGPLRNELESQVRALELSDHVTLNGLSDDVESHLKQAHLLLHSAVIEAFGLVLIEANASGIPVVALDGGGCRDVVRNGHNGFIIDQNKPEEYLQRITEIICNPELYSRLCSNASAFSQSYDISNYIDRLLEIYRNSD